MHSVNCHRNCYSYDNLGNRISRIFGNGVVQAYTYDPVSRLASLTNNLPGGTADDLVIDQIAYNPASQIVGQRRAPDIYAWTDHHNDTWTGTPNGLNQLTSYGGKSITHEDKGNVTAFGTENFTYSSENLLLTGPNSTTLSHDPVMRLYQTVSGGTTVRLAYDGLERIAEYNGSNSLQRRYVFGPAIDEPIVWYEGSGTTVRQFLSSDERGSIVSVTDSSGAPLGINRYDEFGQPQTTNIGKWGYTGQAWMPEISVWYYKARIYEPEFGQFLQPDPIGYLGGMNLYAYVGNDPINFFDPFGLDEIVVTRRRPEDPPCGVACSGFDFTSPPTLLPGPFTEVPDPAVTCGVDCTEEVTITGKGRNAGKSPFFFDGRRYVLDPYYVKPWWSDYFDACFVVCPPLVAGALVAPAVPAVLARSYRIGVQSSRFGNPAFGAQRMGISNTGRFRYGWGRGKGRANFRIGVDDYKLDVFWTQIPKGGF